MKHIVVMSLSGAVGLTALFVVDMLDLFFLSLLGEKHLAAAVGYAGTMLFITSSLGIGLSIAASALVSRAMGSRDRTLAAVFMTNVVIFTFVSSCITAIICWLYLGPFLTLLGAVGEVHSLAVEYLQILVPSLPVLAVAMALGAGLRAVGDAKLSMYSTLAGGAANAVFDPIFIFLLEMDIQGAAIASVIARFTILGVSLYGIAFKYRLLCWRGVYRFTSSLPAILSIAGPAVATNLAAPISQAYVTRSVSVYGDAYVAGGAIIGRLIPVAFGVVFALSGAIGPIIGQNYGAGYLGRVRQALKDAYWFAVVYVLAVSLAVFTLQSWLVDIFNLYGNAESLLRFFCTYISFCFVFNGCLFVANASFNNLGKAYYSTLLNWGKATIGTIPVTIEDG